MTLASWVVVGAFAGIIALVWIRRWPVVQGLVVGNLVAFILSILTGDDLVSIRGSDVVEDLALRPAYLTDPQPARWYTILTSTFLHADVVHVVGNMVVLLTFGLPYEERIGRGRFLAVYFGGAVSAVVLHSMYVYGFGEPVLLQVPLVGASGAIFGVIGGFAATYPLDRIPMFLIFLFLRSVPVVVGAFVMTLFEGALLFTSSSLTGVAHAAHIGGAVGGILIGLPLKRGRSVDAARPSRIDYTVLERVAVDPKARTLVEKVRANEGHPDLQAPWLDRLVLQLRCAQCGEAFADARRGVLRCPRGHEERYVH